MSGFNELRDVSNFFTNELRQSKELFSARTTKDFKDAVTKKNRDIKLLSSKLKLLQAKSFSLTPQINEQQLENAKSDYGDAVIWKVIENVTVNLFATTEAVKALVTTPDRNLDLEMVKKKKDIMDGLLEYSTKEQELQRLDAKCKQRKAECAELSAQWDRTLGELRDLQDKKSSYDDGTRGPMYMSLSALVQKLEKMRWLIGQFVTARNQNYDWLDDPHNLLFVLKLTRKHNTVNMYTQN